MADRALQEAIELAKQVLPDQAPILDAAPDIATLKAMLEGYNVDSGTITSVVTETTSDIVEKQAEIDRENEAREEYESDQAVEDRAAAADLSEEEERQRIRDELAKDPYYGWSATYGGYGGYANSMIAEEASALQAIGDATSAVTDILGRIHGDDNQYDLSRDEWEELRAADTEAEAIEILDEILSVKGVDAEVYAMYEEQFGEEAEHEFLLSTGENATEAALRARGFEGEVAKDHDVLVTDGGYRVQVDADDNIFYITQDNEVLDINNDRVGTWKDITQEIDFMGAVDDRRPIGIREGEYGTADEGLMNVNVVAGHQSVSLLDWYRLYGDNIEDAVTGQDWSDVLFKATGMTAQEFSQAESAYYGSRGSGVTTELETSLRYQYLAGDDINNLIDMPVEDFTQIQLNYEAMDIGYSAAKYGRFDAHLVQLVNTTMTYANRDKEGDPNGFEEMMTDFAADNAYAQGILRPGGSSSGGVSRIWRPPAYLEPDYAEISQAVKLTFEQKMGRAPTNAEISMLSTKMKVDHRAEFDASTQAQKLQFFGEGGADAGTVQDVSYAARFQEDFESKYSDELGTIDRIGMSRNMTQSALGSILSADRAIGY